jgi:hypothetical protein
MNEINWQNDIVKIFERNYHQKKKLLGMVMKHFNINILAKQKC